MAANVESSQKTGIEFYGGYQVYSDTGIDLTLLRENLKLSATDRLKKHSRSLRLAAVIQPPRSHWRPPMFEELATILEVLAKHDVEYVMIGGLAMRAQGSAHITDDFDICYARTPKNIAALAAALASLHPYMRGAPPGLPFRFDVLTIQAGLNFTLTTDLGDVDVLDEVAGVGGYDQALAQSDAKEICGLRVQVLSIDALISSKKAANRAKDRNHVLELEELKKIREASP